MISHNNTTNETEISNADPHALEQLHLCWEKSVRDDRNISPTFCQRDWDHVLCWPPTAPGTFSIQKCFEEFNDVLYDSSENVTRWCNENGLWNITRYESCKELRIEHSDWSDKIFLCGFVLSLIALTVAVIIFLCYRELRCLRNAIHTNLMCSYMLHAVAWLMVLIIQSYPVFPEWLCNTFLFVHNFATLTNFFWMFVEGLYLYMLVVRTFTIENIKLRVYVLIGWGIPVPIIVTWAFWRAYILPSTKIEAVPCPWIKEEEIDWVFKTPPCIILVLNCGFLGRIMWVLITKLRSANTAETQQYRKATKALLVLFPLLGITYLMAIIVPDLGDWTTFVRYGRDFLIGFQGLVVSILYCFFNSEVRSVLRHSFRVFCEQRQIGSQRHRFTCSRESPYVGSENVRLFGNQDGTGQARYFKRESGASDMTTVTYVGYSSSANGRCRSLSGSTAGTAGSIKAAILTTAPSTNCV